MTAFCEQLWEPYVSEEKTETAELKLIYDTEVRRVIDCESLKR